MDNLSSEQEKKQISFSKSTSTQVMENVAFSLVMVFFQMFNVEHGAFI